MSSSKDQSKIHKLALKGSSKLVTEFFEFCINTILFQRGVYPPEDFTAVKKYGLSMTVTQDDQVKAYIKQIMSQLNKWMLKSKISKLVIVITSKETGENVERWQFDASSPDRTERLLLTDTVQVNVFGKQAANGISEKVKGDKENTGPDASETERKKEDAEIQAEIQSIFRQITASVTFLPVLDTDCTFNVLVYADADSDVPLEWGDSDAREVKNSEKVQLRSFSTNNHKIDTLVSYRLGD